MKISLLPSVNINCDLVDARYFHKLLENAIDKTDRSNFHFKYYSKKIYGEITNGEFKFHKRSSLFTSLIKVKGNIDFSTNCLNARLIYPYYGLIYLLSALIGFTILFINDFVGKLFSSVNEQLWIMPIVFPAGLYILLQISYNIEKWEVTRYFDDLNKRVLQLMRKKK